MPFAAAINFDGALDQTYLDGLAAYAEWRDGTRPVTQRCGALAYAFIALQTACRRAPSVARLSTFARCAWDWGRRTECVAALQQLLQISDRGARPPSEPFWPACARFDEIVAPAGQGQSWFFSAAVQQFERAFTYSSIFSGQSPNLAWLCAQPFAATEMERRRFLQAVRTRRPADVPPRLRIEAPDHLNAALWRESQVIAALVPR